MKWDAKKIETLFGARATRGQAWPEPSRGHTHAAPGASATGPAWAVPRRAPRAGLRAGARRDHACQAGRRSCDTGGRVSASFWLFSGRSSCAAPHGLCRCGGSGKAMAGATIRDSAAYNRQVSLPCRGSHENLWRPDRLYDLVIVLDYNIHPRRKSRGSAIFLHCAPPGFAPTEGCVALRPGDLRRLLPRLAKKVRLTIR